MNRLKRLFKTSFITECFKRLHRLPTRCQRVKNAKKKSRGTRDYLNISQNNLIRQIIGLPKTCHMTRLLTLLKIFNFEDLYISTKLSFLASIKNNCLTSDIFDYLCAMNFQSFIRKLLWISRMSIFELKSLIKIPRQS